MTESTENAPQEDVLPPKPQRPALLVFAQTVLMLQAFVAGFAVLTVWGLNRSGFVSVPAGVLWGVGIPLVLLLAYASGKQKTSFGRYLGWVLQIPLLAGVVIDWAIGLIGAIFLALWITALRLGGRIDRERAERIELANRGEEPS